ncbi:MAG: HU family DNA-binding protein [Legionellaceae bacterium]|nr:HU family DNA-binding protein [Legionellaceae bacterium]
MNKSELVDAIANEAGLKKTEANRALDAILNVIKHSLKHGQTVTLTGFGSFTVAHRAARSGRNPQTGKDINIPARKVAKFKVGKLLKEAVQEG